MTSEDLMHYLIRGCRGKSKFKTRDKADLAIDRALERGQLIYWYQCSFCHAYHLTSQVPDDELNQRIRDRLIAMSNGETI